LPRFIFPHIVNPMTQQRDEMIKLYKSAKHPKHWIAYVPGTGWTMFAAAENGWERRQPARGLDPMHVREVLLQLAANTGLIEAVQAIEQQRAA
jgi:hypothetical protein